MVAWGLMVKLYVGVTDYDWFRFLSALPTRDAVNFWQPGGRTQFRALQPGELFLFKLHAPRNFIVGYGIFAHASILPVSLAWEAFGTGNGASSLEAMRRQISAYREVDDPRQDYAIGCRILEQPVFFGEDRWIAVPESWAPNIVSGRTYSTSSTDGLLLWTAVMEKAVATTPGLEETARYGEPTLIRPRLGQGTFRIAVTDAYDRRCTVTGEKTLPILDAAHIRPYGHDGVHDIANGLLLRTDIHRLFDLGYVTVSNDGRFEVGKRLKQDFENGQHYYEMHGSPLRMPKNDRHRPARESLEWHQTNKFLR
jgi:putative restriction endonuclease